MKGLWAVRVLEAEQLLQAGYGAIFFDADAVWQSDVVKLVERYQQVQGVSVVEVWLGVVLCGAV